MPRPLSFCSNAVTSGASGVLRHADAAHKQADALEGIDQAQHVHIVGDAVVTAHLVGDDVLGADDDDDLGLLPRGCKSICSLESG